MKKKFLRNTSVALGGLLFGFDIAIIGGAAHFIQLYFNLNSLELGWGVSSLLLGAILGATISGSLADKVGRRTGLIYTAILFGFSYLATGYAFSFTIIDHRLNCRTVYMNKLNRYLYWNMNYHTEHHMFPLVPYHALSKLHEVVKNDIPEPYLSTIHAWKEIIPALLKQTIDPSYYVKRKLPVSINRSSSGNTENRISLPDESGWIKVCNADTLKNNDVTRFDYCRKTYAICKDVNGKLFATDGICTHGNTHLADGLVVGNTIECPKHNGRFKLEDGSPVRSPVCRALAIYPIKEKNNAVYLNIMQPGGAGVCKQQTLALEVVNTKSVSTFIKEITLMPVNVNTKVDFNAGDYIQVEIPLYHRILFEDFDIPKPYLPVWQRQHLFDLISTNPDTIKLNNYSLANNRQLDDTLVLNVRIATPPVGQDCNPGKGSAYMFNLKQGDIISAIGPFGDFHIKPTQKEMVYIGGGAGMGPIRSHLSFLLETDNSSRKISYWYGARTRQEIYYQHYFEELAKQHKNFTFNIALSSPLPDDQWTGYVGFIHEVTFENYLKEKNIKTIEFYLCGPLMMIKACTKMLHQMGVLPGQIACDEF